MKKANKLFAILLALVMLLSLAACGNSGNGDSGGKSDGESVNTEKDKEKYLAMTEEELLAEYVKDVNAITSEECVALASTFRFVEVKENLNFEENNTTKVFKTLEKNKAIKFEDKLGIYKTLIESEYPQVRKFAVEKIAAFYSGADFLNASKELMKNEKEPMVLKPFIDLACRNKQTDPDVVAFLKETAKNENKYVREMLASIFMNSKPTNFDGLVDLVIELINDPEIIVKQSALRNQYTLTDPKILDAFEAVLKDKSQYEAHRDALQGLFNMWYDTMLNKSTNERAYKITMEYLKTSVLDPEVTYKNSVSAISSLSNPNGDEWRAKATYYNTADIAKLMAEIIADPDIKNSAKFDAIKVMEFHCSKADFEANKAKADTCTGSSADSIKDKYQKAMDKAV